MCHSWQRVRMGGMGFGEESLDCSPQSLPVSSRTKRYFLCVPCKQQQVEASVECGPTPLSPGWLNTRYVCGRRKWGGGRSSTPNHSSEESSLLRRHEIWLLCLYRLCVRCWLCWKEASSPGVIPTPTHVSTCTTVATLNDTLCVCTETCNAQNVHTCLSHMCDRQQRHECPCIHMMQCPYEHTYAHSCRHVCAYVDAWIYSFTSLAHVLCMQVPWRK